MSRLDELIKELCPDGVEYRELREVLKIKNGKDYKAFGEGDIPVYGSGGIMAYVDTYVYDKPTVLIPRKGSIDKLYYVDTPFWNVDTIFYTEISEKIILPRFVYHYLLREHLEKLNTAGGVPSLTQTVLNKVKIPVPPLEVQAEIVRILDNFTELTAELQAKLEEELTARKKQYEYYRDLLLNFENVSDTKTITQMSTAGGQSDNFVHWMFLGDICKNLDSKRKPVKKKDRISGKYPYYGASGIVDYVDNYIFDGDYLLVSEDGANLVARSTPIAFSSTGKIWVNNHAHILEFDNDYTRKFVEIYLNAIDLEPYISKGAQPKLNQQNLNKIQIPMPPLSKQQCIVSILDRFDNLCNDLSSGLPAEIAARQKQYEYYRDRLLTFKPLEQ